MQYEIVTSRYAHEVVEKINELLREGWSLHGELKIAAYFAAGSNPRDDDAHVWMYAQAMIRKDKKRSKTRTALPPTPSVT
jgi:Domain of unknown function (DUF1737)